MSIYKGTVELIGGLTPKNNGTFPLVSAKDVQVDDDGVRLDEKLLELADKAENAGSVVEEIDPTVPDWAKEPTKPTYTAEEVGAAKKSDFDALVGSDMGKTVRAIVGEELASQLIPENANESLNTLTEIATWIQAHPGDASAMNAAITALQNKVDTGDSTVTAYISNAISALKIGDYAKAAELTALAARVSALENTTKGLGAMATKNAVTEGDLDAALKEKVNAASDGNHSHNNKTTLDNITEEKVVEWDSKADGEHNHDGTYIKQTEFDGAVNTALQTAKDSGKFDGEDGVDGGHYTPSVKDNGNGIMTVSFTASKSDMSDVSPVTISLPVPNNGKDGDDGEDGGYYTPSVNTISNNEFKISFTASKAGMPSVADVTITLPAANDGDDGVGIESIVQTTVSSTDGGENVITVTLTNGNKTTFKVKNGSKGSTGKTAFQYAKDAGYTGSEAEFSSKLANNEVYFGNDEVMPDDCNIQIYSDGNEEFGEYAPVDHNHDGTYAKPSDVPAKTSQLTNDSGYITQAEADGKYATPDMIPSSGTSETPYILLPPSITVAAGIEHLIYKDCLIFTQGSLNNWDVRATISKSQSTDPALAIYNDEDHLSIKATNDNVGISYTLNIRILDRLDIKRAEASATVTVVGGSVSGKTAMVIGDSNTASRNGLYTAEIQYNLADGGVTFIGTQVGVGSSNGGSSNGIGDVRHEGYNGAAASNSGKGFTEQYVVKTTPNPFYNATTENFDFALYMANQGYSGVDAVCINLGSNMLGTDYALTTIAPYTEMIDSIKTYDPNIQIIIGLSIPIANQDTYRKSDYTANQMHIRWKNMIKAIISNFGGRESEGIYLATMCHCIDRAHDFPAVEVGPCDRGRLIHYEDGSKADEMVTVIRQVDEMHPHRVGLYKMADALWPSLLRGLQAVTSGTEGTTYTVTNNLTNVSNSNSAKSVKEGTPYTATLTADSGYTLGEVTVTMGGSAVTVTGGKISIASVTGNIVITATATANEPAANLLDFSVATRTPVTTATPENEFAIGYKIAANNLSADEPAYTTNTFAVTKGQKIKVEGIKLSNTGYTNYFRWWFFNSDGSRPYGSYVNFTSGEGTENNSKDGATIDAANNCAIVDTSYLLLGTFENITHARFAFVPSGEYTDVVATFVE